MYHGGVMPDRGIEMLIQLVSQNTRIAAVILGNGEEGFVNFLKGKARQLSVDDRICFHEAVPQKELWKYAGAVDAGMILAPAVSRNHFYSLPNKFFENIQSETPVICPAYPSMGQMIEKYGNGLTCDPKASLDINCCIERLRTNPELYRTCKKNAKKAKEELCWEKEKEGLMDAYEGLLNG